MVWAKTEMWSVKGFNKKNKKSLKYPSSNYAIWPVSHSTTVPVPIFKEFEEEIENDSKCDLANGRSNDTSQDTEFNPSSTDPKQFDQHELSDFIRDLNLSKESSESLASQLKEKNLLITKTRITCYRNLDADFSPLFSQNKDLVSFNVVEEVLINLGVDEYNPSSWRLFIDS